MEEINGIDLGYILRPDNHAETIALARALCPFAEEVTDATMLICVAMVEAGGDMKAVADYLGFDKERIRKHYQCHQSSRIMRELSHHKLSGEGYVIAVNALTTVAGSQSQTGAARIAASKALLELSDNVKNHTTKSGGDAKDLNEMTLSELENMVNTIKGDMRILTQTPPPQAALVNK